MRMMVLNSVYCMLLVFLSICTGYAAERSEINPHSDAGDCAICHVASADKLRGWFVFGSTKREMKTDMNQLCLKCHTVEPTHAGGFFGVGIGHATGKKPAVNHQDLPLANDGTITCATTCHNVHAIANDRQLQLKHLRLPVNALCVSCHNK